MQGIPQNAFLIIIAGIGAVIAIPAFVVLLAPGRSVEVFRRRWVASFGHEPTTGNEPTLRLVVLTALLWLVVGGGMALLAILALVGVLAPPPWANPASFAALFFGGIALIAGLLAILLRRKLEPAWRTTNRMLFARPGWDEFITPGTTLGLGITIAVIGLLVVIYGFTAR